MKTVGDDLAFPDAVGNGLTKREYFAAMALQGLTEYTYKHAAEEAVKHADALIEALNAKEGET
jgi:hypothetical protein